jgi:GTP-binding protein
MIMAASKIDVANKDKLAKLKRYCKKQGLELFPISAVTGKGIDELEYAVAEKLDEVKANLESSDVADQKESPIAGETELPLRSRRTS